GHYTAAVVASQRALAMGTRDARLHYHAGFIALAGGDLDRARSELGRALAIGPAFDPLLAARARAALALLENMTLDDPSWPRSQARSLPRRRGAAPRRPPW